MDRLLWQRRWRRVHRYIAMLASVQSLLWLVFSSQDPTTVAYLDVDSGELVAIRGDAWRVWDFLWSLHIMDYDTRDHIGTPLLKVFSVMALLSALLGLFLFVSLPKKWT